ncbi:hypothetical protein [Virgibacillus ainsalahensis]
MKAKIAVFGRKEVMDQIHTSISGQDEIEVIPFTYTKANEVVELIEKAFMCDIYLFTEALPYLYASEKIIKKRLPAVQVAFDEYMILTSFYRIKNYHNLQLNRISIDVLHDSHVEGVLHELDINDHEIYTYSYGKDIEVDIKKIVKHHQKLWDSDKIDYVLTSVDEVEQQLRNLDIPTIRMIIPKLNMERAIEQAKSIVTLNQSKSAQIVAGYVQIKNFASIKEVQGESAATTLLNKLHEILNRFGKKTYASVLPSNVDQFVLFGTRGILDHITDHYRDFPMIREIEQSLQLPVDIGFGLGLTAKQAEDHAKLALEKCEQTDDSSCYIVNDRKDTIGPLGVRKQFDTSKLYQSLIHKARLNNELSYNFIDFIQFRNNEPFSSNDVATFYSVTKRSAERTINKLLSGEVIKVVGEEKPYVKGRPRKLFTLNQ